MLIYAIINIVHHKEFSDAIPNSIPLLRKDIEMSVEFSRNRYPYVPPGARGKGDTLFHRRARFWERANRAIGKFEAKSHSLFSRDQRPEDQQDFVLWVDAIDAVLKFEEYCGAMDAWYKMLNKAAKFADRALKEALLDLQSEEGRKLYEKVQRQYAIGHPVEFPKLK